MVLLNSYCKSSERLRDFNKEEMPKLKETCDNICNPVSDLPDLLASNTNFVDTNRERVKEKFELFYNFFNLNNEILITVNRTQNMICCVLSFCTRFVYMGCLVLVSQIFPWLCVVLCDFSVFINRFK